LFDSASIHLISFNLASTDYISDTDNSTVQNTDIARVVSAYSPSTVISN